MIFDFIERNNMKTGSKVADTIRSDEIVLRMESTDDAEKLIQFINNNPYLKENSRPTNPFLNRAGVVGVGYDDLLSYNQYQLLENNSMLQIQNHRIFYSNISTYFPEYQQ